MPGRARRASVAFALLALVGALAGLELLTRVYFFQASKDLSRFRSYPAQARDLAAANAYRIALVGNSATEEGVDVGLLESQLAAALGRPVRVAALTADNSHLTTWRWMIERYFFAPGQQVDLLVVPFFGPSLADGQSAEIGRLAQFFTTLRDWPELMREDLHDLAARLDFAVSSVWATWAVRERIRQRIFVSLLPGYKIFVSRNEEGLRLRSGPPRGPQRFTDLDAFLRLSHAQGARLCFVTLPTRDEARDSEAAAPALQHLAGAEACVIDLQDHERLAAADFADAIHLNESGRRILSGRLAAALARVAGGGVDAASRRMR